MIDLLYFDAGLFDELRGTARSQKSHILRLEALCEVKQASLIVDRQYRWEYGLAITNGATGSRVAYLSSEKP